jgi:hypothetical protein
MRVPSGAGVHFEQRPEADGVASEVDRPPARRNPPHPGREFRLATHDAPKDSSGSNNRYNFDGYLCHNTRESVAKKVPTCQRRERRTATNLTSTPPPTAMAPTMR